MKKNILPITVILVLCLGWGTVFAGGARDSGTGAAAPSVAAGPVNVTYPITVAGAKRLSYWIGLGAARMRYISGFHEHEIFQAISKDTGVEIEWIHPAAGQEAQQLGLLLASLDLPDILQIRGYYPGGSNVGVAEGIFRDLTDFIPVHAPDYYREIRRSDFSYRVATTNESRITEFMLIKSRAPVWERMNYRQDIIDRLNLKIPVTFADYEENFAKMVSAGLTPFALPASGKIDQLMWPFGISVGFYLGGDGKVKWGEAEPEYRQYLELMNSWYTKGYISPDFMSTVSEGDRRMWFANGITQMMWTPVDLAKSACDAVGAISVPLPWPRLYPGQQLNWSPANVEILPMPQEDFATVISTACRNPEVAVQYLNYTYTQAGADLMNWGIKDIAYTVDANGNKRFTDYMLRNPRVPLGDVQGLLKVHQHAKLSEADIVCNPNVVATPETLEIRMRYSDDPNVSDSQVLPAFRLGLRESERRNQIMRDITNYVNEMTLKFITNVTPLSEFDDYLAQVRRMGIEEAVRITQEGYEQFLSKPGRN